MLVDLILSDNKYYTFEGMSARAVGDVLNHKKIPHRIFITQDGNFGSYLEMADLQPPDWTLSFSNLISQQPLCDFLQLPHFYWVEDSLAPAYSYLFSKYGQIGLSDRALCKKIDSSQVHYLPYGINRCLEHKEKTYAVICFADCIDLTTLGKLWVGSLSDQEIDQVKKAIGSKNALSAEGRYFYAEQFLLAEQTVQILERLQGISLDIFGEHIGSGWQSSSKTRFRSPLPFLEKLELLSASAILIANSESPWYRIALEAGCLPLSPDREEVEYYLSHPTARHAAIKMRLQDLPEQSWDHQVRQLIEVMAC